MANKDLFKQAIAEAKSVREAAIANAKEALEESLTPHLKDMLAAKLQEMEDKDIEEEAVNEVEEEVEEGAHKEEKDEAVEESLSGLEAVAEAEDEEEAEDDSEETEDEAETEEEHEEAPEDDADVSDLSVEEFKDLIRDIIAQEVGGGDAEELPADDMDAGDIEGIGDESGLAEPELEAPAVDEPEEEDAEIDLDELLAELEGLAEEEVEEVKAPTSEEKEEGEMKEEVKEEADSKELEEAMATIEVLKKDLQETNLLNSKLLYVNKIFKANNLSEAQKVNVIAAFDKAETVKEVKLVFETVSENVIAKKAETIKEHRGMASKATGTTASKPEVINEVSDAVRRMQKLAGII